MFLSVWCVPFSVNFGEVTIPTNLVVPGGTVEIPTLPPIQECPVVREGGGGDIYVRKVPLLVSTGSNLFPRYVKGNDTTCDYNKSH